MPGITGFRADMIALSLLDGVGARTIKKLIEFAGSSEGIFSMAEKDLACIPGLSRETARGIRSARDRKEFADEIRYIEDEGIDVICPDDGRYPEDLKNIYDPPAVIFSKGVMPPPNSVSAAIVGARNCSLYGLGVAETFAGDLARRGVVVVSGMAKGIDSAAHRGALSAGGVTVAVMGTGFRHIYPEGSEKLIKEICRRGAVLTEFTSGVFPGKNTFPRRNRIISGMSKGVIVVEAAKKSGALITVDFALEQGKDVFAVPGQIGNPMAAGTNLLIQNGAKIAISAADILEEIAPGRQAAENTPRAEVVEKDEGAVVPPGNVPEIRGKERDVLDAVTAKGKTHVDEIMAVSGVDEKSIHKALLYLELKGAIRALPGAMYERAMS